MSNYYVNKKAQPNGDHEVHLLSCSYTPIPENQLYLGSFGSCAEALREAKKSYSQSNGCYFCCKACHTS